MGIRVEQLPHERANSKNQNTQEEVFNLMSNQENQITKKKKW